MKATDAKKNKANTIPDAWRKDKPKFRITKHHVQGAIAMLLVCAMAFSAVAISNGNGWLFGTVFEGYEDAQEKSLAIEETEIEAVKDYAGQTFTITGLPKDEIANIKPEHIFLGGYFSNLTVTSLETAESVLLVTIGQGEAAENSGEVDWEDYSGFDGIIAISPKAFKEKSNYYQGLVTVIYPELVCETEQIAQESDLSIAQEMTIVLKNDSFAGTLTERDLQIKGGFESVKAENFKQDGNTISFTLVGIGDGNFSSAQFIIPGDKLTKGLEVEFSVGIGRVPVLYQASPLCVMDSDTQSLEIFADYDAFTENINLAMLSFGGVMNEIEVNGLELVNMKTIRLTLKGRPKAGNGTVEFDSAAVTSGRLGRIAEITVVEPELVIEQNNATDLNNPSFTVTLKGVPALKEGDVSFTLDGALSGLSVSELYWTTGAVVLYTSGTAQPGEAVIRINGLYQAEARFEVTGEQLSSGGVSGLSAQGADVPFVQNIGTFGSENIPEVAPMAMVELLTLKGVATKIGTSVIKGIAKKAGSKIFDEIMGAMGMSDPSTGEVMDTIMSELGKMSSEMSANNAVIKAKLNKIDYDLTSEAIGDIYDPVKQFYKEFQDMQKLSKSALQDWEKENLAYNRSGTNKVSRYLDNLDLIFNRLDPGYSDATKRESLILKFERESISHLPFEHNVYMSMVNYVDTWDMEIAQYFTLLADIYAFNAENTGIIEELSLKIENLTKRYVDVVAKNIDTYIKEQPYKTAYDNLKPKDHLIYLITTDGTNKYLLSNNSTEYKIFFDDYHACPTFNPYPDEGGKNNARGYSQYRKYRYHDNTRHIFGLISPVENNIHGSNFATPVLGNAKSKDDAKIAAFLQSMKNFNQIALNNGSVQIKSLNDIFNTYLNVSKKQTGESLWWNPSPKGRLYCGWQLTWSFSKRNDEGRFVDLWDSNIYSWSTSAWYVWDDMYQKAKSNDKGSTFVALLPTA